MNYTEKGLLHTLLGEYASMLKIQLNKYNGYNSMTDNIQMKLAMIDVANDIIIKTPLTEE